MKVIIAGCRDRTIEQEHLDRILANLISKCTEIVSGGAFGIDHCGEEWATRHNIPIKQFLPDWDKHGRAGGPIRNEQMAQYADMLVAVWDRKSRGTKNMISQMEKLNKPIVVINI